MAKFTIDVKKAEEFTINELAIIKDEIETLILRKHPTATINSQCPDLDTMKADLDKTGYVPEVVTPVEPTEDPVETVEPTPAPPAESTEEEAPSANWIFY